MRLFTLSVSSSHRSGACAMNLWFTSWFARGRRSGSFCRHAATNSLNASEKLPPSNRGGGFFGMKKSTRMGCRSLYGGVPLAASIAVMPSDQMSHLELYPSDSCAWITSGAIQKGVPVNVRRLFPPRVWVRVPATPKSARRISPVAVSSTFAHLTSRWIFPSPWR